MFLLNVAQTRAAEQAAAAAGISPQRLMENAGAAAAKAVAGFYTLPGLRAVVVAGNGNNGGDGFVVARKLKEYGAQVAVLLVMGMPATENSNLMLTRLRQANISVLNFYDDPTYAGQLISQADLLIDAIFGIGFHGAADRDLAAIIALMNRSKAEIVALDLPSGVVCDTGKVHGAAVRATRTVTFIGTKPCHFVFPAADYCGALSCVSIGVDEALIPQSTATVLSKQAACAALTKIPRGAHKGTKGTALIFAGSYKMPGAACFAALAALRAGAGLVRLAVPKAAYPLVAPLVPEAVFEPYNETEPWTVERLQPLLQSANAVLIGPGLGVSNATAGLLRLILKLAKVPVVVDADALTALADNLSLLNQAGCPVILTPHPGEMSRLLQMPVPALEQNRLQTAGNFAKEHGVITLLKGAYTVIAGSGGKLYLNTTGNAALATPGSGDVLAGMITAFAANGTEPLTAAAAAACLHGAAGDEALKTGAVRGLTVRDVLLALPRVFHELL